MNQRRLWELSVNLTMSSTRWSTAGATWPSLPASLDRFVVRRDHVRVDERMVAELVAATLVEDETRELGKVSFVPPRVGFGSGVVFRLFRGGGAFRRRR